MSEKENCIICGAQVRINNGFMETAYTMEEGGPRHTYPEECIKILVRRIEKLESRPRSYKKWSPNWGDLMSEKVY